MLNKTIKLLKILWTSPNSLLGLSIGIFGLCFGGRAQFRRGCVEFYGGLVTRMLNSSMFGGGAAAMTLGHTILGQSRGWEHELVHVRQYERWGPFFLPAYLGWSAVLWIQKKDYYFDNPFEIEAYSIADPRRNSPHDSSITDLSSQHDENSRDDRAS
jgi:hypothetical protein